MIAAPIANFDGEGKDMGHLKHWGGLFVFVVVCFLIINKTPLKSYVNP